MSPSTSKSRADRELNAGQFTGYARLCGWTLAEADHVELVSAVRSGRVKAETDL